MRDEPEAAFEGFQPVGASVTRAAVVGALAFFGGVAASPLKPAAIIIEAPTKTRALFVAQCQQAASENPRDVWGKDGKLDEVPRWRPEDCEAWAARAWGKQ